MSQNENVYNADFETTTKPDDCRVWLWWTELLNGGPKQYGLDILSFVKHASLLGNSVIYFHNLGFDGSFILDWLLNNGYKHILGRKVPKLHFSTMISGSGTFYSITVHWRNGTRTEFRDSLKKIPLSVFHIAKSFKLSIGKGHIDYELDRPIGYKPTVEELDYVATDVSILSQALAIQLNEGMSKLTVGADSLAEYKKIIGKDRFDALFPILPLTMDAEIRQAYRGGWTLRDKRFAHRIVGPGRSFDVNSLYPSVMYDRLLPYGVPIFHRGAPHEIEDYPLYITSITFTATIKKDHLPCIQVKNIPHFIATEYQEEIEEPITMACTNVDLELWHEHYDIDIITYNGTWYFKGMYGAFNEYIDKWMHVKENSEGGMRLIAKLHLNSLYGKFATNPDVTPRIPELKNGVVHLRLGDYEERQPVYTAMGVFITAYARSVTIQAAQLNYDVFAYADTDSIHLITDCDPTNIDVDKSKLGAWKREMIFSEAYFARAKCYTEKDANEWHCLDCDEHGPAEDEKAHQNIPHRTSWFTTHIAGLPDRVSELVTFEDYTPGRRFEGKLLPKRVRGGIVLEHTGFTLNL